MSFSKKWHPALLKATAGSLPALLVPVTGAVLTHAPALWPVSVILYNVGLLLCFLRLPKKPAALIAYNLLAAFLFLVECSFFFSYYLQNDGFNEAFFYHLRPDLLYAGVKEQLPVLLALIACLGGFLAASSSALRRERGGPARLSFFFPLGLLFLGLLISPPVKSLLLHVWKRPAGGGLEAFRNFPELRRPHLSVEFRRSKRPNIVLLYAESLEQRYFDEAVFPGLLPNLKKLRAQSVDFANVSQGAGAGWTVGGMFASQCGYPLAGSHDVNYNELSLFDEFAPKAVCLGDLLEKDGYRLTFVGGADARFAGKGNFLRSHGYREILDRDDLLPSLVDPSYLSPWGIFDDSLFDSAMDKFLALSREKTPFLMTMLTLDNHGPIGYLSKSCGTYGSGDNSSLNSVHCSDQLISRFIDRIRRSPFSENTIIVVLSDHLSMRNKATPLLEASRMPQRLTFFVNMPDGRKEENANPGVHYDIAPTILDLAGYGITGQMGFGAPLTRGPGYLPGRFGEGEWEKQSNTLMAIGSNLWDNEVVLDQRGMKFSVSNLVLAMGGREFDLHARGVSKVPSSTLFVFDERTLKLETIQAYPFDQGLKPGTLSQELLKNKEKLALVISRAVNLPGFTEAGGDPDQWVFFCGKPGGELFTWGPITKDLLIPFDLIREMSRSKTEDRVIQTRERMVKMVEANQADRQRRN